MNATPVLDVGGSHVSAALVDTASWRPLPRTRRRAPLDSDGTAEEIIASIAACAQEVGDLGGATLAVAMPGPFDYEGGIGRFEGVAKFDALNGVDVGAGLLAALPAPPAKIVFLNDAVAFALGEWVAGGLRGCARSVAITLGTGVGSAFLDSGSAILSGPLVPPSGSVHLLSIDGMPLEDVVSTRAIVAAYRGRVGDAAGVRQIAQRAEAGDHEASRVLGVACAALGVAIAPWLARFGAEALVVGGGIAKSWRLIEPPLREGIESVSAGVAGLRIVRSDDPEASTEVGAAWHAVRSSPSLRS